ncbi:M56 family metallopeptidase [Glycocaulis profundi]|nr:M56 family metallopeptidase [Glycocaulis profundi]
MNAPVLIAAFAATIPAAALGWLAAASLARLFPARRLHDRFWRLARWMALVPPAAVLLAPLAARIPMPGPAASSTADAAPAAPVLPILFEIELQPVMSAAGSAAPDLPWVWIIAGVWLAGLALCAARMAGRRLTMVRLLRAGAEPSPELRARFEIIAAEAGVPAGRVRLRVIDAEVSPFVTGLRPVIALPASMAKPDFAERAGFALAHELAHVRRGDERDRIAGELLGAVLWFNPVLALIESRLALAREFACDAEALDRLPAGARRPYGRALIASGARPMPALAGAAFLPSHRRIFEMRIQSILRPGPVRTRTALAAGAAAFAVLAAPLAMAQVSLAAALTAVAAQEEGSERTFSAEAGERFQRALALNDAEDHDAALAELDGLLETELTPYEESMVHRVRGATYFELDDLDAANAAFRAALDSGGIEENEAENIRFNIGQLMIATGDTAGGLAELETLIEGPEAAPAHLARLMAQAYAAEERWADARPYQERYLSQSANPGAADYRLLEAIYANLGMEAERAEAEARRRALEADPD